MQKVKVDSIYVMPEFFETFKEIFNFSNNIGDWKTEYSKRIDESVYKSQFKSFDKDKPFNNPICKDILPIFDPFYFQLNKV